MEKTWAGFDDDGKGCVFTVAQASCPRVREASSLANEARQAAVLTRTLGSVRYLMFTGIVEEAGIVERIRPTTKSIALTIRVNPTGRGLKTGGSLAVNGCCLTAVKILARGRFKLVEFDLLRETWRLTNLQFAKPGSLVNLERPLRTDGEFGGHFVTGHIDGLGKIIRWERAGQDHLLDVAAPPAVMRYVIRKGSIAVDGISLTVAAVQKKSFRIWIIPHTFEVTALRERRVGDAVNLEADLLGKYARKFLSARGIRSLELATTGLKARPGTSLRARRSGKTAARRG